MNCLTILFGVGLLCLCSAVDKTVTVKSHCTKNGKVYNIGDRITENPCSPCFCSAGGQMACMAIDCMMPSCVDYVRKPGQCCAICPNGNNCRLPDGNLLSADKSQTLADGRICKCSHQIGMGWLPANSNATCTPTLISIIQD